MKFDNHNCRLKLTKDSSQKTMAKTNFLIANSKPSLSKWCEKKWVYQNLTSYLIYIHEKS